MTKMRAALLALLLLLGCHLAEGQTQETATAGDESGRVRQAVQSYLETTAQNLNAKNPVPSQVVHPRAKIFSTVRDELLVSSISTRPVKKQPDLIKTETTDRIVSVDVTGSMAVVKVETIYPYGSLTATEYNSLSENDPLRTSAGKQLRLTSYLSLLKLGGEWKIVSFLTSNSFAGDQ
ncbi:MAG: nuclear transport factor 2 family protein [Acidobacteria bacterium]|nr:nuclear transport factor 2 family protein [Acidobacteriota bacterium]